MFLNNTKMPGAFELNKSRSGLVGGEILFFDVQPKLNKKKPKGNKSQDNDCYKESTISHDKKIIKPKLYWQDKKESKESIDKCKEIYQEE